MSALITGMNYTIAVGLSEVFILCKLARGRSTALALAWGLAYDAVFSILRVLVGFP